MRKRWLNFLKYCLRVDCVDRIREDGWLLSEIVDEYHKSRVEYAEADRRGHKDTEYLRGYSEGIGWVLKVK